MTTTQRLEPYASEALELEYDGVAQAQEREISIFVQPDLALLQSKGATARRLFARRALRTFTFASGDAIASASAAVAVRIGIEQIGTFSIPYSGAAEVAAAVVLALTLTGSYRRSAPTHPTHNLLLGSAIGALVVFWARMWPEPTLSATVAVGILTLFTACALFLMRGVLSALTEWLLPEDRRLVPALVLASADGTDGDLDPESGFRTVGRLLVDGRLSEARIQELARMIRRIRAESVVVLAELRSTQFARVLEVSLRAGCEVLTRPPGYDVAGVRPTIARRGPYGLIQIGAPSLQTPQFVVKRLVDIVGASAALVLTAPLWVLIAIVIRLDSPGPVFFRQERVGIGGRRFRMLKFRTMRSGADEEKESVAHLNASGDPRLFKIPNDPRVSRVGRFLRRWSLDELPQFLNVIGGSMSLVGPRPFFERDFAAYEAHHFRRLGAKPGITGMWQVFGRSSVLDFEEVVRLDTEYIDGWSLWLDLRILARTLPAVVGRKGAC
jgi:exopolysaccharide biosynthesis polyprenyl glycosylphosphotransferase